MNLNLEVVEEKVCRGNYLGISRRWWKWFFHRKWERNGATRGGGGGGKLMKLMFSR